MSYRPYTAIKATGLELGYQNNSGSTLTKGTPLCQKSSGYVDFINVSLEADVFAFIGIAGANISNATRGPVTTNGRVENVTVTGTFGDAIYVSKTGGLTNVKPDIGVGGFLAGDFVLRVGTIAKNETNPALKDIVLEVRLIGQLHT
jgi:hypothetical protein